MSTLKELYITMENLRKLNLPIDDRLKKEAAKLEEDLIRKEILPVLTEKIAPALHEVQRELVLVVDYVPGEPLKVSLSRKRKVTELFDDAIEIKPDPQVPHKSFGPQKATKQDIAPKTVLRVTMPDGSVIELKSAKATFVDVIKLIGVKRVRQLGLKFCRVPIISNTRDDKYGKAQIDVGDGWLILTHSSTADKKKQLDKIAKELGLNIVVEII